MGCIYYYFLITSGFQFQALYLFSFTAVKLFGFLPGLSSNRRPSNMSSGTFLWQG